MIRRSPSRCDAMILAAALVLQLAPSIPPATATPIDLTGAWHRYATLVRTGAATGGCILDAVRTIR